VAVIEALAAGTPVVATAVGGVAEIVPEGCGTVVPREDEAGLSRALAAALRGGFRVPDEARDEVVNRFSEARTADAVRALYDEILSRKGHVRRVR
jgi:glycosyltransferase involved in cell wall biosynthesis